MGGSVRKEMINSVTHVVANTVFGSKYKVDIHVHMFCCFKIYILLGCCLSWCTNNERRVDTCMLGEEDGHICCCNVIIPLMCVTCVLVPAIAVPCYQSW